MMPFSDACERNRQPIAAVLRRVFAGRRSVLEIGSGTGQHAVYFGAALPHLTWQPSDLPACHAGIRRWLAQAGLPNVLEPIALDVHGERWSEQTFDAFFCANVIHIVSWAGVESMFRGIRAHGERDALVALYGPYNYGGNYTSPGNADFDAWLRSRDAASGIRDFEAVDALARRYGCELVEDNAMPANNRLIVWRRTCERAVPASL